MTYFRSRVFSQSWRKLNSSILAVAFCLVLEHAAFGQFATAFNTLRDGVANLQNDVYSFDPSGGSMFPFMGPSVQKNSFYINAVLAATLPPTWEVSRYLTGDFAGDKLLDVAAQVGDRWYIGTRVGNVFQFDTVTQPVASTPGTSNTDFIVGNFFGLPYNGIGTAKEDIAYRKDGGTWMILPSTGSGGANGFSAPVGPFGDPIWAQPPRVWPQFHKLDVNADGLDDIVGLFGAGMQMSMSAKFWVAVSTGAGFVDLGAFTPSAPDARTNYMFGYSLTGVNAMCVGDFNRDGKSDIAAWNQYLNNNGGPNKIWVGLSTGTTFDWDLTPDVNEAQGGDMPWGTIDVSMTSSVGGQWVQVGDFNGDANAARVNTRDDIVYFGAWLMGTPGPQVKALMSNGVDGFNRPVNTTTANSGASHVVASIPYNPLFSYQLQNAFMVGEQSVDGRDDLWVAETNGTAFRIFSTAALPPPGSGLSAGFGLLRESPSYLNWCLYPTTMRIFPVVGRYWAN